MRDTRHILEQVVEYLCQQSQQPFDDPDRLAGELGAFADEYLATHPPKEAPCLG